MTVAGERARAKEIVARLQAAPESSDEVFAAFAELDALPVDVVREALESWLGPAPDLDRLELDDAARRALRIPPRKMRLAVLAFARDADILDRGERAEEQIRAAGESWDGADLDAFERLDGEAEGTFAGTLEHVVLGEGTEPRFEVVRFLGDAGVIFRAGTLERVGFIADGRVEVAGPALRAAIQAALAAGATGAAAEPSSTDEGGQPAEAETSARRAPPKKASAKKASARKTTPAKKTAAKKTTAPSKRTAKGDRERS